MSVESLDHPLALHTGFSSVDRGVPCVDVRATAKGFVSEVSVVRGLRQQVAPMTTGFSPTAEALQGYPQGSDREEMAEVTVFEGSPAVTLAAVPGLGGFPLAPAAVVAVVGRLYSETRLGTREPDLVLTEHLDPRLVFKGQLITGDPRWLRAGGFNFEHTWPGHDLVGGGSTYRIEYEIRFMAGGDQHRAWVRQRVTIRSVLTQL